MHNTVRLPANRCHQFVIRRLTRTKFDLVKKKEKRVQQNSFWKSVEQCFFFSIPSFKLLLYAQGEVNSHEKMLINSVWYLIDPPRTFSLSPEETAHEQTNTKTMVPLDAVSERRTERCSSSFRSNDRFCEMRFRYKSSPTGSEGEISRPLPHLRLFLAKKA